MFSNPFRDEIRQTIADMSGKPLADYSSQLGKRTIPESMQHTGAGGLGGEYRNHLNLGMSFLSAIQSRNMTTLADTAGKMLFKNYVGNQLKISSYWEDPVGKIASEPSRLLEVITGRAPIAVIMLALKRLYGEEFLEWEPETIFMELQDDGVTVDTCLENKINCGMVLALQPDFLNDSMTFENCVRVLNGLKMQWDITQKPDIAHLNWGVIEGLLVMDSLQDLPDDTEFSDEVELYVATALHHDHYMLAPDALRFCQDILEKFNNNNELILPELKKEWEALQEKLLAGMEVAFEEDDLLDIQLGKLVGCWSYMYDRFVELEGYLERMS